MTGEPWDGRTVVYRLFAADGRPLYVGQSRTVQSRIYQHMERGWWHEVERVRITIHPDVETARAAEADEIRRLRPAHNIYGRGPRNTWTAVDYIAVIPAMIARCGESWSPRSAAQTINRRIDEFARRFPVEAASAGLRYVVVPPIGTAARTWTAVSA